MNIQRISAPLGALVRDIDVRQIDKGSWSTLNELFLKHHVLAFPGQSLTEDELIAFAAQWGPLIRHPYAGMKCHPDVIELRNTGKRKDINQHWHSDMTYNPQPPKFTMLYAKQTPEIGGDTAFSNQILAYQNLSSGLKQVLSGLTAEHTAAGLALLNKANAADAPKATHPVVRTHDETGEQALYVCGAFTERFTGWSIRESKALLELLYEESVRPEFQARHRWQVGDVVMWDNRCLLHYAVHDHGDEQRIIQRVQVEGSVPA
ncbi:MAG: taurine dioxygenase [Candidatus Azotimanducaceae bacterium]|jgi:taurine dioxygenase